MKIATFNCALLNLKFFFLNPPPPTAYVNERKQAQLNYFNKAAYDVLLLQEVYSPADQDDYIHALSQVYPFYFRSGINSSYLFKNDLIIFSKFPILESRFFPFKAKTIDEFFLADKGFLKITIQMSQKKIDLINVHLTSGGVFGPESNFTNRIRAKQIQQILKVLNPNIGTIIAGDFNCGLQTSFLNYKQFLEADMINLNDQNLITWDPENNLNKNSYHKKSPPQQIDHIIVSNHFHDKKNKLQWSVFGEDFLVKTPFGDFSMSDHLGVLLELSF